MTTLSKSIEYLKPIIKSYNFDTKPLVIGISGTQGSGKSYLSDLLTSNITKEFPELHVVTFSSDDLYLTHGEQCKVAASDPSNKLIQGRGLPGTHDIQLGLDVFRSLLSSKKSSNEININIPIYDKSKFGGEGDRLPIEEWKTVTKHVDIIIFEGWFNGFQPMSKSEIVSRYTNASPESNTKKHSLENIKFINEKLHDYTKIWDLFDYFIYLACDSIDFVYDWRIEQEHDLISKKGTGMTDLEVRRFVDRYMPVYELYYDRLLEEGVCKVKGANLKLAIDKNRHLMYSKVL